MVKESAIPDSMDCVRMSLVCVRMSITHNFYIFLLLLHTPGEGW
jgi:hypothetical protein